MDSSTLKEEPPIDRTDLSVHTKLRPKYKNDQHRTKPTKDSNLSREYQRSKQERQNCRRKGESAQSLLLNHDYSYPLEPKSTKQRQQQVHKQIQNGGKIAGVSNELLKFWQHLQHSLFSQNNVSQYLIVENDQQRLLWNQCWSVSALCSNNLPTYSALPKILMLLPNTRRAIPPVHITVKVLHHVLSDIERSCVSSTRFGDSKINSNPFYSDLETSVNVVRDRLLGYVESTRRVDVDPSDIESLLIDTAKLYKSVAMSVMTIFDSDNRMALLYYRWRDFEALQIAVSKCQLLSTSVNSYENGLNEELGRIRIEPWRGWCQQPTVGWLMSKEWHDIPRLKSFYESPEDYGVSLLRVWTLLTFYWGAGALWPKCHAHQQGPVGVSGISICGEPLLTQNHNPKNRCSSRHNGHPCDRVASWRCSRHGHDSVCDACLFHQQNRCVGEPGPAASTDVYDAVIERETLRREGSLFVASWLQSRKPPTIAPSWRTSYRLQVSCLVGIVKLGASREPLSRNQVIQWAEVVPCDMKQGRDNDWQSRASGRIAFKLLSRTDSRSISRDVDIPLDSGTRIAIIDLRVFVPEVISVLATFAHESFQDHLSKIPFIDCLIGRSAGIKLNQVDFSLPTHALVTKAIQMSEIDAINRLSPKQQATVIDRICKLKQCSSLYGTQLEAFVAGLTSAVHCTQGPPGTGKSYVGVALVLALTIIRDENLKAGHPIGPVLMLSYKNHALDEFLCDVLEFSSPKMSHGMLIRTGNPENPILAPYAEKGSKEEKLAEEVLKHRVDVLRKSQKIIRDWKDLSTYFSRKNNFSEIWTSQVVFDYANYDHQAHSVCFGIGLLVRHLLMKPSTPEGSFKYLSELYKSPICEDILAAISARLSTLVREAEHWLPPAHIEDYPGREFEFWIQSYLRGLRPPPRCKAFLGQSHGSEGVQCMELAAFPRSFCSKYHSCRSSMKSCDQQSTSDSSYCSSHKCLYPGRKRCKAERLKSSSFCQDHVCRNCIYEHKFHPLDACSELPVVSADCLACITHKCKYDNNMVMMPFKFCIDHICNACLTMEDGFSFNSERTLIPGSKFCKAHQCSFQQCTERALQSSLCLNHLCVLCAQDNQFNPVDSAIPGSRLCENHRCKHQEFSCVSPHIDLSPFCIDHTCRVCFEKGSLPPHGHVTEDFPRNTCEKHLLCSFIYNNGALCLSVIQPESLYCSRHTTTESLVDDEISMNSIPNFIEPSPETPSLEKVNGTQCMGLNKKGKRCKCNRGVTLYGFNREPYCNDHKDQAPRAEVAINSVEKDDSSSDGDPEPDEIERQVSDMDIELMKQFVVGMVNAPAPTLTVRPCYKSCSKCPALLHVSLLPRSIDPPLCPLHNLLSEMDKDNSDFEARKLIIGSQSPSDVNKQQPSLHKQDSSALDIYTQVDTIIPKQKFTFANSETASQQEQFSSVAPDYVVGDAIYAEAPADDINPDELDVYDNSEEFDDSECNEELRRLREIVDHDKDLDDSTDSDIASVDGKVGITQIEHNSEEVINDADVLNILLEWTWTSPVEKRWAQASKLLEYLVVLVQKLRLIAEDYVTEAHSHRAEAGALAFKNAKVVGATVVGAARRLEAIRAAEPFAVLVEESCEVMEPTLMAVLAVKSLRKLELIGDHRQLPAFVQNSWFNLELSHPSIKTSLFERLVGEGKSTWRHVHGDHKPDAGYVGLPLACSILDEQRRMRESIADLTRFEYRDLVQISDHPLTKVQRIGDRLLKSKDANRHREFAENRELWDTRGREVPGVLPSVFFWNLIDSKEGRPDAGLSACNPTEANAVCQLVQYLSANGVPHTSITIITPYKGQKIKIIKLLRAMKLLPSFHNDEAVSTANMIIVSTVDRYQGDENDIVILSLVRTRPGNRFVALLNRFIVAVSRARLGCYIVGSVDAVIQDVRGRGGPDHWKRFVNHLSDISSFSDDCSHKAPRLGSSLPICCPRHRSTQRLIGNPALFPQQIDWNSFCREKCHHILPDCKHQCEKLCHNPILVRHTEDCQVLINSPCDYHGSRLLVCHEIRLAANAQSLQEAISKYQCDVAVNYRRLECSHVVSVRCHRYVELSIGNLELEACDVVVEDFVHPRCNHVFHSPKCADRRRYEDEAPQCQIRVENTRPCGCTVPMYCYEKMAEVDMNTAPKCLKEKTINRPRCSHKLSVRCHVATRLNKIFEAQYSRLTEAVAEPLLPNQQIVVQCGAFYSPSEKQYYGIENIPKCSVSSSVRLPCGHILKSVPCFKAFEFASGKISLPQCCVSETIQSPLCHHTITVPCWVKESIESWKPWQNYVASDVSDKTSIIIREDLLNLISIDQINNKVIHSLMEACSQSSKITRLCYPNHVNTLPCKTMIQYVLRISELPKCNFRVSRMLGCQHEVEVFCYERFSEPPSCLAIVENAFTYPCSIHTIKPGACYRLQTLRAEHQLCPFEVLVKRFRCDHNVSVACHESINMIEYSPGLRLCETNGIVLSDCIYCDREKNVPPCTILTSLKRLCGHIEDKLPCNRAFAWAADSSLCEPCAVVLSSVSPLCGHNLMASCSEWEKLNCWDPWVDGELQYEDITVGIDHDGRAITTRHINQDDLRFPSPPPAGLTWYTLDCGNQVVINRNCGHNISMSCVDLFGRQNIMLKCKQLVKYVCSDCNTGKEVSCSDYSSDIHNGAFSQCSAQVMKTCFKCCINILHTSCCVQNQECNVDAKCVLSCGHEVRWRCGKDVDPRTQDNCRVCVSDLWKAYIDSETKFRDFLIAENNSIVLNENLSLFQNSMQARLSDALVGVEVERSEEFSVQHENFINTRLTILKNFSSAMFKDSKQTMLYPHPQFASEDDFASYHIVYFILSNQVAKKNLPVDEHLKHLKRTIPTKWGQGYNLHRLMNHKQLEGIETNDGLVRLLFGIAFSKKCLPFVPAFKDNLTKHHKFQKANQQAKLFQIQGNDCVSISETSHEMVYWMPNSVYPLCYKELKLKAKCVICTEYADFSRGFFCSKRHFICWEGCFDGYVASARQPDRIRGYLDAEGNLRCPDCGDSYNMQAVAIGGPPHTFESLMHLKLKIKVDGAVTEAVREETAKLQAEFERIQKIQNLEEREAEVIRLKIVDEILTLKCPRCKLVFFDFDGCFALTCLRCNCAFCAWCLLDCGNDAHAHVVNCPENTFRRGVYGGGIDNFHEHHKCRRKKLIEYCLRRETVSLRNRVIRLITKDLAGLGITL